MVLNRDKRALLRNELRAARLRANLRQEDVAQLLGKPQSFVSKAESGERKVDFVDVLNLCDAIQLDPVTLVRLVAKSK